MDNCVIVKKAFLQLHLSVFLAGFTGILGKLITLNEGMLVWYRLLITAVTMYVLFRWQGKLKRLPLQAILRIGGTGCIVMLHWIFFYGSIKYANVSIGVVCFSLTSLLFRNSTSMNSDGRHQLNIITINFTDSAECIFD